MLRHRAVAGLAATALIATAASPAGAVPLAPGENALISIPSGFGGLPPGPVNNSHISRDAISDDGCRIVFYSESDGLVEDDLNDQPGVYVRDRCAPLPTTQLVSRGSGAAGPAANDRSSGGAISSDGTLVAFRSSATNLTTASANPTADVNGSGEDIFVRDLVTDTTYFVSRTAGLNGAATTAVTDSDPSVTRAAGSIVVVFDSYTDALVPGDTNGTRDVFVRNVTAGSITRANVQDGTAATQVNGFARNGVISENGQWVAFDSDSTNMNALDATTTRDIYVRNIAGTNATLLASHTAANAPSAGGSSQSPAIDADGTDVAWYSDATNLSAADTNNRSDVYVATRAATFGTAQLISRADGVAGQVGNDDSYLPRIDDSGARIGFSSRATNLAAGDAGNDNDTFVRLRAPANDTILLSGSGPGADVPAGGEAPAISGDGLRVAFRQFGADISADADASAPSILTRTIGPAPGAPELVSRPTGSGPFQGAYNDSSVDQGGLVSPDGRFVAFSSASPALFTTSPSQVYLRDTLLGTTTLVTRADGAAGAVAESGSYSAAASVSADGTRVAFVTRATNLAADDTNNTNDLFVRDLAAGTTTRIGRKSDGTFPGVGSDALAALSADGRFIAFDAENDLLPVDTGDDTDVYVQELATGALTLVSRAAGNGAEAGDGGYQPAISADGSRVAFGTNSDLAPPGVDANTDPDIYVRDMRTGELFLASRPSGATAPAADGNSYRPSLDGSGTKVAFVSAANLAGEVNATRDVFVRDLTAGTTTLVSRADSAAGAQADADSDAPGLSSDGTLVSFSSLADNLGAGPQTQYQGYLRDLVAGTTQLLTRGPGASGAPASLGSYGVQISGSGNCAVFTSRSPNLVAGVTQTDFRVVYLRGLRGECPADPPNTTITSGPTGLTSNRRPAFGLAASEAATFSCTIDGAAASACASGFQPAALADGQHTLSAVATDSAGYRDASAATRSFTVDGTAPLISKLRAAPSRFRVSATRRRAKKSKTEKLGTRISFRLSEPGAATLTLLRERPGRKSGKRCAAPRKGSLTKRSQRCTRLTRFTVVTRPAAISGINTIKLARRIGKRTLTPGVYRLALDARDVAGNRAAQRTIRVTVLKPRAR